MRIRTILDGNAFYEIDEECMENRKKNITEGEIGTEKRKNESSKNNERKNRK